MGEYYVDGGGNIPVRNRHFSKSVADDKMRRALEEIAELGRKSYADGSSAIRMGKIAEAALDGQGALK